LRARARAHAHTHAHVPIHAPHALALARTGTLIVVDNAISRGRLIDPSTGDPSVDGLRAMMDFVSHHPRLEAAGMQTVGAKGYDGFLIATVVEQRIGGGAA
jgi:predicted O-methyltransferase YrrM